MGASEGIVVLFDPQSDLDCGKPLLPFDGHAEVENQRSMKCFLMEEEGYIFFCYIGNLATRQERLQVVLDVGGVEIISDGDEQYNLPSWYDRVDLPELREVIERLIDSGDDTRDWYAAPLLSEAKDL